MLLIKLLQLEMQIFKNYNNKKLNYNKNNNINIKPNNKD